MEHLFVPYDIARQLKEKGFDELCLKGWHFNPVSNSATFAALSDNDVWQNSKLHVYISAPLYAQVVDWFREKHDLNIVVLRLHGSNNYMWCFDGISKQVEPHTKQKSSYYEALTKAIEEALKLI